MICVLQLEDFGDIRDLSPAFPQRLRRVVLLLLRHYTNCHNLVGRVALNVHAWRSFKDVAGI